MIRGRLLTPGKKWVSVKVVNPDHVVREDEYGIIHTIPLLHWESGLQFTATCLREFVDHGRNCPVLVTGDPGIGKTTMIVGTALAVDPKFPQENVTFALEDFDRVFRGNPYGDGKKGIYPQVDADESAAAMYGPEYQVEEQRVIVKNLLISRIKRQIVYFAAANWKHLNPHLRNLVSVWFVVKEPDYFHPGYAVVKFAPPNLQNEYAPAKLWVPQYAMLFPRITGPFWEEYERRKMAFVDEFLSMRTSGVNTLKTIAKNLNELGLTQEKIAKAIGRSQTSVSNYLADAPS